MNIYIENIDHRSSTGPNHFAKKIKKYLSFRGCHFSDKVIAFDKKLTFIQTFNIRNDLPMCLRLDGIYFNAGFDCDAMNSNIKRSYDMAKGIVFQTNFNKELIFKWFGPHDNYTVINNGADMLEIKEMTVTESIQNRFSSYDNIWSCAAHWHSFKRLKDNINYFLKFSEPNDCLVVAGSNPDHIVQNPRIHYVGNLSIQDLFSLYKISKYFIHLAYLDHCPNVVIDARSCGARVICSSSGGTKEIAGENAIVIQEPEWDYSFIKETVPPPISFDNIVSCGIESDISMTKVAKKYHKFLLGVK